MMDDKRVFTQLLAALLIGLFGVVTTLLLLSQGASAQPMLQEQADLTVYKSDDPEPAIAGEALTYTLVITNGGPVTATNVLVTDTLPAGVTIQSATPSQGTCGGTSVVTCSLGNLIVSQTAVVSVGVAVDPATRGTLSNVAEVSADEADPVSGDNTATAVTTVTAEADLAITKTDDPDLEVIAGETLTYTLTATNNGPSDSAGVVVTDTLPLSVTLVTSATTQGWYNGATGVWTVGSLTDGGSATLTLLVTVDPSARGTLSNFAEVSGDETDPTAENDEAGQGTPVDPQADLVVAKTDDPDLVSAGEALTYTLTVTNSGPSDATGVTVVDDLPDEVSLLSATPSQGGCVPVDPVTCDVGALASGANATVSVVVSVTSPLPNGTILTNAVTVDGNESDPNDGNDSAQAQTTVQSSPVLTITKHDDEYDPVDAGGPLRYTLVITNSGNENATSITVTEHYDPNVSFFLASPPPDEGTENRWTLPVVTVGDPTTIDIGVTVTSPLTNGTVLTNQVTLDSDQTEPLTVTEFTTVTSTPVLMVTKIDLHDPVRAGRPLTYAIGYQNSGNDHARGVVIMETYDSRVTYRSADPPPRPGTNNIWDIPYLPVGGGGIIIVTVGVDTPLSNGTILTNLVTMTSTNTLPLSVTETTRVSSAPDLTFSVADHPDLVDAGDLLTYTLRYTNTGNADATGVVVTATLDVSTTFSGAVPPPDGGSDRVWVWNVGTIPGEGGDGEILVYASVPISLPNGTILVFTATLQHAEGDLLEDTAPTEVRTLPDLTIGKVGQDWEEGHKPSLFSPGKQMDYIVTYGNVGYEDAQDVVITTTLPTGTSYKEIGYGWQPAGDGLYTHLVGTLDDRSTGHVITFTVTYADVPCQGVRGSTTPFTIAPREGLVGDANSADNTISVTIGVPDLVVTGFGVEPWPLEANQPVTFTVTLKNQGTAPAWNPEVTRSASYMDILVAPVASCPWERDSEKAIWDFQPVLYPGDEDTMVITLSRNWDGTPKGPITFTQEEIDGILAFYVKLDNSAANHYGYIPEGNEMNNIFPRARYLYLPLILR